MRAIEIKIITIICLLCLCGCSENDDSQLSGDKEWTEHTVAVVLPMENGLDAHWKRTLGMFTTNFGRAFRNQSKGVRLRFEYYDESTADIPALAEALAFRDDIYAVIGGLYSSDAGDLAAGLTPAGKTYFTLATAEQLVRAYWKRRVCLTPSGTRDLTLVAK